MSFVNNPKDILRYEETLAQLVIREEANSARLVKVEATVEKIHKVLDLAFTRFESLSKNPIFASFFGAPPRKTEVRTGDGGKDSA